MKKKIILIIVAIGTLGTVNGAENLQTMFSEAKVSGQIREFSISRTMDFSDATKDDYTRMANAIWFSLEKILKINIMIEIL